MKCITVVILSTLILVACNSSQAVPTTTILPTPQLTIITSAPPTLTPIPTPLPTIEEWIYPYTIPGLRQHEYQSGEIKVGEMLEETDLFTRYAIEYPSDGLTITGIMQIPRVGRGPFPVIVMNHGFFSRQVYASGDGTDRAAEFLNRHGI
jgi:hypothetical protein